MARRVARDAPVFKNPTTYQSSIYGYFSCNVDILRKSCLSEFLQGCKSACSQAVEKSIPSSHLKLLQTESTSFMVHRSKYTNFR